MEIVILVGLMIVGIIMIVIGILAFRDASQPQPQLPLLFSWAQGANQAGGYIFGTIMVVAGLAIGGVGVANLLKL